MPRSGPSVEMLRPQARTYPTAVNPQKLRDAVNALDEHLQEVARGTEKLNRQRQQAQADVVEAIRAVEQQLQIALAGHNLRGCQNLAFAQRPIYGWNVRRANKAYKIEFPTEHDREKEALVLTNEGDIALIRMVYNGNRFPIVEDYEPSAEDYQIEDLPKVIQTVAEAITRHCFQVDKSIPETQRIWGLAQILLRSTQESRQAIEGDGPVEDEPEEDDLPIEDSKK